MVRKKDNKELNWYDSGNVVTSLIIGVILLVIICSQSFAVGENSSLALFGSVINHNSIYLLVLIYFTILKTREGKKYFNYLNIFLIFIYLLATLTSLLTVLQSFSLNTILIFSMNFVLIIYLVHTMLRDTLLWKEFGMENSPFNELSNEFYFNAILILSLFLLAVNLVSTVVVSGVIISIIDSIYMILFSRYVYLYGEYLNREKISVNNLSNFDEVREAIKNTVDDASDKINSFIEENKIDERLDKVEDKIVEGALEIKDLIVDSTKLEKKNTKNHNTKKHNSKKKGEKK